MAINSMPQDFITMTLKYQYVIAGLTCNGVAVTSGGQLKFKIVHMALPEQHDSPSKWREAVIAVLEEANVQHFKSLSFPAIGTGKHFFCIF